MTTRGFLSMPDPPGTTRIAMIRENLATLRPARTPEQGHTKRCLARAIICAVENYRDTDDGDVEFVIDAQNGMFLTEAFYYLETNLLECICPDTP